MYVHKGASRLIFVKLPPPKGQNLQLVLTWVKIHNHTNTETYSTCTYFQMHKYKYTSKHTDTKHKQILHSPRIHILLQMNIQIEMFTIDTCSKTNIHNAIKCFNKCIHVNTYEKCKCSFAYIHITGADQSVGVPCMKTHTTQVVHIITLLRINILCSDRCRLSELHYIYIYTAYIQTEQFETFFLPQQGRTQSQMRAHHRGRQS